MQKDFEFCEGQSGIVINKLGQVDQAIQKRGFLVEVGGANARLFNARDLHQGAKYKLVQIFYLNQPQGLNRINQLVALTLLAKTEVQTALAGSWVASCLEKTKISSRTCFIFGGGNSSLRALIT